MANARKKILVTGGAGYIGSHTVVELAKAGYEPVIVDNFSNSDRSVITQLETLCKQSLTVYEINCNDKEKLRDVFVNEGKIFGVIHFAAFKAVEDSVHNPLKYYRNNLGSLLTLLELMDQFDASNLVFSSSCSVYGETGSEPVCEDMPLPTARSPYGFTKQVCEQIINDAVGCGQALKAASLRYFNPIGAHASGMIGELPINKPSNLIPYLTQTAAGMREELVVFGADYDTTDGSAVRDYIHITDLAKAHVSALNWLGKSEGEPFNEIFNIGTGNGHSVLEVINTFNEVNGIPVNYRMGERREGDVESIFAEIKKAHSLLRWQPELKLSDALRDAWNWQQTLANETPLEVVTHEG